MCASAQVLAQESGGVFVENTVRVFFRNAAREKVAVGLRRLLGRREALGQARAVKVRAEGQIFLRAEVKKCETWR